MEERFEQFERSCEAERLTLDLSLVQFAIESAAKFSADLKSDVEDLTARQSALQQELFSHEQRRSDLSSRLASFGVDTLDDALSTGDYFQRLNALEIQECELRGRVTGLRTVLRRLQEAVRLQQTRNGRLAQQLAASTSDPRPEPPNRRVLTARVDSLRDQAGSVSESVGQLRDAIRDRDARIQVRFPGTTVAELQERRADLAKRIAAKRRELQALTAEEAAIRTRGVQAMDAERRSFERIEADDWEAERRGFHAQIAQARAELATLQGIRAPSAMSEGRRKRVVEAAGRWAEGAMRKAMQREIEALRDDAHPIAVAMRAEQIYGARIDEGIARAKEMEDLIRSFSERTFGEDEVDEGNMRKQRITALNREYEELREELRTVR
jgi:chromosome segregation ATPase